ncbi:MAG: OsmC family protein [Alistipes sp.]|nr:OsmC family protein [Alistipes sp.]
MNNKQRVTVELNNGKFRLTNNQKVEDLNPKALIICAAAECAGYTIMSILRREEVTPKSIEITVEGSLDTPTLQPESKYKSFSVHYRVECRSLADQDIVGSTVKEAQEYRCGVINMLRAIAPVSHEIDIVSTEAVGI